MEKALERLGSMDPSDSMADIMSAVVELLQSIEKGPSDALSTSALKLVSDQEKRTREYYLRPFDSDDIYNTLIELHSARGEGDMVDRYRRCIDLRQARKWTIIGDSYALMGLNARAVTFLKRALFFGPSDDLVEEVERTHDKAQKRMEKANSEIDTIMAKLSRDPTNPKVLPKAISYLIDLDRLDEAERVLRTLPARSREDPEIMYKQGCVLFGMDDFGSARDVFEKVLQQTPNSTSAKRAFNMAQEMIKGIE
ncbi:MAG: hypothetical protein JXA22_00995 [Candidatus Thermoplasmatota archaeon]|nr:hypothetical protein [Candidatus Thermoplasmatota archaeon]